MRGTIVKRNDGRYMGAVDIPSPDGKRKRKYVYGKNPDEVERKVNEIIYQVEHSIYRDPRNATIESLVDAFIENFHGAETTKALYKNVYAKKHIKESLGQIKIKDLKPSVIQKFYNDKLKGDPEKNIKPLSKNTVLKLHRFLHEVFEFAIKDNIILVNPMNSVTPPQKTKFKPNIFEYHHFMKLLDGVKGTFDEVVIALGGIAGLRRGEIFGLKWKDIDFENNMITIAQTRVRFDKYIEKAPKTDSSCRTFIAPKIVFDILKQYQSTLKIIDLNGYVCDKYLPDAYTKHFKKLLKDLNLPVVRLHDLRHYFVTMARWLNIPDVVTAGKTGHAQISTLREVYQHSTGNMDKISADMINKLYQNA